MIPASDGIDGLQEWSFAKQVLEQFLQGGITAAVTVYVAGSR